MAKTIEGNGTKSDGALHRTNSHSGQKSDEKRFKPKIKINQETLPLKITLFLISGAMSAILPYVTIHMQAIGISINEVAIIYAVLPFTSFVGPPILGALADRFGNYKWILILTTFGNGLFHTLLLFVPQFQQSVSVTYPLIIKWDSDLNQGLLMPQNMSYCHLLNSTTFTFQHKFLTLSDCQEYSPEGLSSSDLFLNSNSSEDPLRVLEDGNCFIRFLHEDVNVTLPDTLSPGVNLCKSEIGQLNPGYGNNQVTFWVYFFLRVIATTFMGSCFSLLDATTLAVVKRCGKAEFGKERMFSILGSAIVSPIAGVLVDQISRPKGYTDYSPAFYLSDALLVCGIITFFLVELQVDKPEKGVLKNAVKLLHYPEVVVFLVMIFLLGNMWGFVESYLFIFLKELEAPNYLLGLTLTVGSLVGLPFLWGSEKIVAKFGRVNLIIAAFFTYFFRFFGYSYLRDPFWCFPFEAMEAFTYHLMWTAAATYCSLLAPKGMLASLIGIMGSLHYSLGKGAGSFLGGITYGIVGARHAFRYFGVIAGIFGIVFFILDFFWIRKIVVRRISETKVTDVAESGREMQNISRRGSIYFIDPIAGIGSMVSLDDPQDISEDDEVIEEMIKK